MKSKWILFSIIILLFSAFGCDTTEPTEPLRELSSAETKLVEGDNSFGFKLFKNINAETTDSNVFISPLSISMALGMTYNGSAGSTEEAMRTTLEFGDLSMDEINESYKSLIELLMGIDSEVEFNIGNSIWYRNDWTFKEDFFERCNEYFDARVRGLDFSQNEAAKDTMNNWVDENTNGKIEEIVDYVNPLEDVMFLINAIYFKGNWTYRFNEEDTKDGVFHLSGGGSKVCKMMQIESDFKYFADSLLQVIDIPYGNENYSMVVILPSSGVNIDNLIAELTQEKWEEWMSGFSKDTLTLLLPKFKLEYKIEDKLEEVLTDMGMGIAFDDLGADFTGMYEPGGIFIDRIIHKTFLEVDEEGTEAAAATVVDMGYTSIGLTMYVNRPFIFAIRENHSGTILFMGKIAEPAWE